MIPIFDLKEQYLSIRNEVNRALEKVFNRGLYILGEEVALFEKEFSHYIGCNYGIGVASGTDALTLALRVLDLTKLDEVIIPVNAYPTFFGVAMAGVDVRFADSKNDGTIDPDDLKRRITKKTKAIVIVHLYGNPADIHAIQQILRTIKRTDIRIIEDCAQAHGATINQRKVGTFGDIAIYSFYPSKNLGGYGDGGILLTNNALIAKRLRRLRMYGEEERYKSQEISGVSRLDEIQAAILRVKLRHIDQWNAKRKILTNIYRKELCKIKQISILPSQEGSCHHLFVIRTKERDVLKQYLETCGIGCAVHYPYPLHLESMLKNMSMPQGTFPVAEALSKEILTLPLYPELKIKDIKFVIRCIGLFYS